MAKIIMHIDLNCFFASCECLKDPSLEGKPLIVASSSRRGIVSTASYEARKYGISSAMPTYQAIKLCPDVIIRDVDFEFYHKKSEEFFSFVRQYTPIIEIASVDECYADMTSAMKNVINAEEYLKNLQNDLLLKTGLRCSIGLSTTKFLAKMGSDYKKPMGITIIRKKDISSILYKLPIRDMFGIGKKTCPRLMAIGIKTIGDLAKDNTSECRKILGKGYDIFKGWLIGEGSDEVITEPEDPKSISNSSTFLYDTDDYDEIKNKFYDLCQEVSVRAKKENKIGTTIQITLRDASFSTINRSLTFSRPTNNTEEIYNYAMKVFDANYKGELIRLVGVALQNLMDKSNFVVQMSLFDISSHREECATKLLINELNSKVNKKIFISASELKKENK